jgi:hypothetical protein
LRVKELVLAVRAPSSTHFFTVSDQDKSKDFCVRILGGKVIKPDNPSYIKLADTWLILSSDGSRLSISQSPS